MIVFKETISDIDNLNLLYKNVSNTNKYQILYFLSISHESLAAGSRKGLRDVVDWDETVSPVSWGIPSS